MSTTVRPHWGKLFHIALSQCPHGAVYRKLATHDLFYHPWSAFSPLRLSFNDLAVDLQTPDLRPTRLRRYANFDIDIHDDDAFHITDTQSTTFQQDVDDFRNAERAFAPMLPTTTTDPTFLHVLGQVAALTKLQLRRTADNPNDVAKLLNVSVHQVRLIAYPDTPAQPPRYTSNAPEGIHRDGADYIVSAFVMNRHNVRGGETVVYDNDAHGDQPADELYRTTLEPSTLFFQEDRHLWHDVTPLHAAETDPPHTWLGYRDLLGLDVTMCSARRDKVNRPDATRASTATMYTNAPATPPHTRAYSTRRSSTPRKPTNPRWYDRLLRVQHDDVLGATGSVSCWRRTGSRRTTCSTTIWCGLICSTCSGRLGSATTAGAKERCRRCCWSARGLC